MEDYFKNKFYLNLWKYYERNYELEQIYQLFNGSEKNVTFDIIKKYPNPYWDWRKISRNPNITVKILLQNPHESWDWQGLSKNKNLTTKFVRDNLDKPWDWSCLSRNHNLKSKFIAKNIDKFFKTPPHNYIGCPYYLISHPNLTVDIIENNLHKPWNFKKLSENPNLTEEFILKSLDKGWDYSGLSKNKNISWEFLREHLIEHIPQNLMECHWLYFRNNPNINSDTIDNLPTLYPYMEYISSNPNVTMETILNHPTKPWNYNFLSSNPNLSNDFIQETADREWNWDILSLKPNLDFELVNNNMDKKWNWDKLSMHPDITWEVIYQNLDKPWRYTIIKNPNIYWKIIEKNKKIIHWKKKHYLSNDSPLILKKYVNYEINIFLELLFNRLNLIQFMKHLIIEYLRIEDNFSN